jgi:hypothetical protein
MGNNSRGLRLVWCCQLASNNIIYYQPMKLILLLISALALLATSGCIFPGGRDRSYDQGRPGYEHHEDHPAGVDHGEHPVDMDHGASQQ